MLTKSDVQAHRQCKRRLWLERYEPHRAAADSSSLRRAFDGNRVGERARSQLGPDPLWPPGGDDLASSAKTAFELLKSAPRKAAVEVPLVYNDVYARSDALVPDGSSYIVRETKASSFPLKADKATPADPEDHHVEDLALQAWVAKGTGLRTSRYELNLLDGRWRYPGNGNYAGLFRQMDVTALVEERLSVIPAWVDDARKTLAGPLPGVTTGRHCGTPYQCPFHDHCLTLDPEGPEHPIELLPDSAGKKLAAKLRQARGYVSILDPTPEELTGAQASLYRRIQQAHRSGTAVLDPGSITAMKAFPYPRYFLDFEGIDLAVPLWQGFRPYEQAPFQWSCHIERAPGSFQHEEFLDLSGGDPSLPCIEALKRALGETDGPIFVYHATYERGRLRELGERHALHADAMNALIARLVDLLPIVKQHYYHPSMRGSFSIKAVLPTIAPNLSYDALDVVQDGTGAQSAFLEAALTATTPATRKRAIDRALRLYCRQDTWAMIEVAYFLSALPRPTRPRET